MPDIPLVSISCITYNHAPFIRQCLDGFMMQKANFPIEVLIHDDASTDGTADIIREYEQKYPEIIKPIYQTENQYSKGVSISKIFNFPRVKGKYLALCEGDDYWIDPLKLQKQVSFLEKNEDFAICFHSVKVYDERTGELSDELVRAVPEVTDIKELADGNYLHTPSVMYRTNQQVFEDYLKLPRLLVGDYILHMLFADHGKIKKVHEDMAIYRLHENSSWEAKPLEYRISNMLKALTVLIFYYRDSLEICSTLIEQYRNTSVVVHPEFHKSFVEHKNLESKYGKLESKYGNLESKYGKLESKYGNLESKYGKLESKYGKLLKSKSYRAMLLLRRIAQKTGVIVLLRMLFTVGRNKRNIVKKYNITSLASFVKAVEMIGGIVFGKNILSEWNRASSGKKIFLISHELSLTGAPIALYYFAEYLKGNGKHPIIFSPSDGSLRTLLQEKNIPVVITEKLYHSDIILQSASQCDLVVVNTLIGAPIVSALNHTDIPSLWWVHESLASYPHVMHLEIPEKLNSNIHIYCGGHYAAAALQQFRPNYKVEQLLYYVSDYAQSLHIHTHLQLSASEGKCIFAIVGTLEERKGQTILVQAIRLLPLHQLKRCFFVFVGKNHYAPALQEITQIYTEYPQNVQYIEELNRNSLQSLYQQIDCLICSSKDDPMPIVVTEAMLMSKIIICSENTGSAKLLKEMSAGLIYNNNSPEELSALIEYVIENRHDLSQMQEHARRTYERYFTEDAFNASVDVILQNIFTSTILPYTGTVSVVIPTYNGGEELCVLIGLLNNQVGIDKIEIIIVDSGSTDGTAELAENLGAVVIRIAQADFSHSYARNLGAKNARGDYLLFMTQDALPTDTTWLNRLIQPLLRNDVVAVSCKQKAKLDCDLLGRISIWAYCEYMELLHFGRFLSLPKQINYNSLRKNAQLDNVTCLIRKDIFMHFLYRGDYAEDLDLGIRLIQAGYKLSLLSSVQVIHSHTRPASYYLKRSIVTNLTLKKLLPDYPIEKNDLQTAINKIVTAYYFSIYLVRYLSKPNKNKRSFSSFSNEVNKYFNKGVSKINKMPLEKIKILIEENACFSDTGIQDFIKKILSHFSVTIYDPTLAISQVNFIAVVISDYLNFSNEEFTQDFEYEICDMLIKLFGQMAGDVLAGYRLGYPNEKNSLQDIIDEYSVGV